MKRAFELKSLVTGLMHRVGADGIREFYESHVLQAVQHMGNKLERQFVTNHNGITVPVLKERVRVFGTVLLELFGPDGGLKDCRMGGNLVTTAGLGLIIDRMQAASEAVPDYIAIGTGTTAAAAGDTALGTEAARGQGALSQPAATTDRCIETFAAGTGTGAITECGRLNAGTSGTLYCRKVFAAVNKGASDSLQVTYDITISAA